MSDKLYKIPMTNASGGIKGVTNISSGSPLDENNIPTDKSAYKFNLTGLYKQGYSPAFLCISIIMFKKQMNHLVIISMYLNTLYYHTKKVLCYSKLIFILLSCFLIKQ